MAGPAGTVNLLFTIGAWQDKWRLSRCQVGRDTRDRAWAGVFRVSSCVFARLDYGFDISQTPEALANGRFTGWDGSGFVTSSSQDLDQATGDQLLFVVHDENLYWWENTPERAGEAHPEVTATVWMVPDEVADAIESTGHVDFPRIAAQSLAHRLLYWDGAAIVTLSNG